MTEEFELPARARVVDLLRPQRLFAGLAIRPTFVLPALLFVLCVVTYTLTALAPAIPRLIPALLASSPWTESELARTLRVFFLVLSLFLPLLFLLVTSLGSWTLLTAARERQPLVHVLSLFAHVSLWAGIGFLAKALLVKLTGQPEPPVNLSFFLKNAGSFARVVLAFTNPFLILALVWTVIGLRAWGVRPPAVVFGGVLPWAVWIGFFAVAGGGAGTRFAPAAPVSHEGWETIDGEVITVLHPPGLRSELEDVATILDGFSKKLAGQFGLEPRPLRVHVYPDHATLERATGEFLHVRVTGSVRGRELLYMEAPGTSPAMPQETALRDAMRYVALMQLAPGAPSAPRWFVEAVAHAATFPYTAELEREYVAAVRKIGVPTFDILFDDQLYRTPEGPVLARSLVDFIAYQHGSDAPGAIYRDVAGDSSFRDALFSRTRLTTSALEKGWQQHVATTLQRVGDGPGPGAERDTTGRGAAAADSGVAPFLPRH